VELLQDHQFTPDVTRHLRKMKAARQIEAVELMIAANTITSAHADALLKATPPEQRTDYTPPKAEEPKGNPLEQIVKLEREMNQVQAKYKRAEESYGSELLNLVVAKGYLKKVLENEAVRAFVGRNAPEILEQFELVLNTVSMEEAVEQVERGAPDGISPSSSRTATILQSAIWTIRVSGPFCRCSWKPTAGAAGLSPKCVRCFLDISSWPSSSSWRLGVPFARPKASPGW
jgi:hypothetical protein